MPTAIKVLHVYSGNLFGGIERMLISLTSLDPSRLQHDFAVCFEGKLSAALRERGASVELLPPARMRNPLSLRRTRAAFRYLLRARQFDAVICHSIWPYCIFAPIAASAGYAPILFLHDAPDSRNWYYRWARLSLPDLCIANSTYIANLAHTWQPKMSVKVVHPLVSGPPRQDSGTTGALRARLGAKSGELVLLQASRFDSWKGHRNLLGALHAVRDVSGWRCWIAGAPQRPQEEAYRRELVSMIAELGLTDRVSFIGHRDDMAAVLGACDIYCQPNETPEPFGMVFVEALYAGKPILGSALGGALEIVTEDCGILCEPRVPVFAAALRRLLEDHGLRSRMSVAGPVRAAQLCGPERFSTDLFDALEVARS